MDAYAHCPCGTGKKVKFCCPDLLEDFQKIQRMLDGEQHAAAQQYVESLLQKEQFRDRASLLALRGILLRHREAGEEAAENARHFLEVHPDNPIAMAEVAINTEDVHEAMRLVQRALEVSNGLFWTWLTNAWFALAQRVLARRQFVSAMAMLSFLSQLDDEVNLADTLLDPLRRSPAVPLLLKRLPVPPEPPDGVAWKAAFDETTKLVHRGLWARAAERLAALAAEHADVPAIWLSLALVRAWLLDNPGAIDALRRYAALDVPLEDAVEAEAVAILLLGDDWFGDQIDEIELTFTVRDPQRLHEQLLSNDRVLRQEVDPSLGEDGSPAPKLRGILVDRSWVCASGACRLEQIPRVIGSVAFFGKQTDREARLEIRAVGRENRERILSVLSEMAGESIELPPQETTVGQVSETARLSDPMLVMPTDSGEQLRRRLRGEYYEQAWLEHWIRVPMKLFDGRTPSEAAALGEHRIRLLAAILVLESYVSEEGDSEFDFNRLRAALGLPVLEPIDPASVDLATLPLVRLGRLKVDGLSSQQLYQLLLPAYFFHAIEACRKFAGELAARGDGAHVEQRLVAHSVLAAIARSPDEVLEYAAKGREIALRAGRSCAQWDLLEVPALLRSGHAREAIDRLRHIESHHMDEPGVAEQFTDLLVRLGILRPDGTVAPRRRRGAEPTSPEQPEPIEAAESGKLWTPDSPNPSGGGGGSLWTPE